MKKRQRVLPCGRVFYFDETTAHDIGRQITMKKRLLLNKKKLDSLFPFDNAGRRNDRWAGVVYNRFVTHLTEKLVTHLLTGDRVETFDGHKWGIYAKGESRKDYVNWHTDGQWFGVGIQGINGKFGIRLSKRKRRELRDRINSGQQYHVSN